MIVIRVHCPKPWLEINSLNSFTTETMKQTVAGNSNKLISQRQNEAFKHHSIADKLMIGLSSLKKRGPGVDWNGNLGTATGLHFLTGAYTVHEGTICLIRCNGSWTHNAETKGKCIKNFAAIRVECSSGRAVHQRMSVLVSDAGCESRLRVKLSGLL